MTADGWTVSEACEQFAAAGLPIDPRRFRMVIRALPGFQSVGEEKSGERGGRGHAVYDIGQLQRLHSALAPWLSAPISGDT